MYVMYCTQYFFFVILGLTQQAKDKIKSFHSTMLAKSMTETKEKRIKRIIAKLWVGRRKTDLQLNTYSLVMSRFQAYVKVFQSADTLVHMLHNKQLQVVVDFFHDFISTDLLDKVTPRSLVSLDVTKPENLLPQDTIFLGSKNKEIVQAHPECNIVSEFKGDLLKAYQAAAIKMQKILPINSHTLKELSALDPGSRGSQFALKWLPRLCARLKPILGDIESVDAEVRAYCVDRGLSKLNQEIVAFWCSEYITDKYPVLQKAALASLSIFHGPRIEGSFSVMSDIVCPKRSRLDIEMYAALQTVKYSLKAHKQSACQFFRPRSQRKTRKFLSLCASIRTSGSRRRRFLAKKKEERAVQIAELGLSARNPGYVAAKKRQMKANNYQEIKRHYRNMRAILRAKKRLLLACVTKHCDFPVKNST